MYRGWQNTNHASHAETRRLRDSDSAEHVHHREVHLTSRRYWTNIVEEITAYPNTFSKGLMRLASRAVRRQSSHERFPHANPCLPLLLNALHCDRTSLTQGTHKA